MFDARFGYIHEKINNEAPNVMHIDLNSCFATVEQQANPHLRGRPVGVTNRISPQCCMVALSYEAKFRGAKVGMRFSEVKDMVPDLIVVETDPPKYHYVYEKLLAIMKSYSPKVQMKSIDEGIVDFHGTRRSVNSRSLEEIGYEIKDRLREDVGSWMKCNIGISTNRFLAKLASNFNKPDGLTVIDHENIEDKYRILKLTDLPGIANRFEARLNRRGIDSPIDFLNAPPRVLKKYVFQSIIGVHWHQRIRGYEVDDVISNLGNVGRQHVFNVRTQDERELVKRFSYLCYTTARKLRYNEVMAKGIYVYLGFQSGASWYKRHLFKEPFNDDRGFLKMLCWCLINVQKMKL
jgi:DNA polymerase-4